MLFANDRTAREVQDKFRLYFHEAVPLINSRSPQQKNAFDCGLYLIVIAEEFCRFFHENVDQQLNEEEFFEGFMNEIQRTITSDYVNQRRKDLKSLLESMSIERKKTSL